MGRPIQAEQGELAAGAGATPTPAVQQPGRSPAALAGNSRQGCPPAAGLHCSWQLTAAGARLWLLVVMSRTAGGSHFLRCTAPLPAWAQLVQAVLPPSATGSLANWAVPRPGGSVPWGCLYPAVGIPLRVLPPRTPAWWSGCAFPELQAQCLSRGHAEGSAMAGLHTTTKVVPVITHASQSRGD